MTEKQSPPRRQPAAGRVIYLDQWHRKYPASSIRVQCIECQAPFERLPSETWKVRCRQCWAWLQIYHHHKAERRLLREVQS